MGIGYWLAIDQVRCISFLPKAIEVVNILLRGGGGEGLPRYLIVKGLYLYDHPRIVSFFIDYFIVVERRRF